MAKLTETFICLVTKTLPSDMACHVLTEMSPGGSLMNTTSETSMERKYASRYCCQSTHVYIMYNLINCNIFLLRSVLSIWLLTNTVSRWTFSKNAELGTLGARGDSRAHHRVPYISSVSAPAVMLRKQAARKPLVPGVWTRLKRRWSSVQCGQLSSRQPKSAEIERGVANITRLLEVKLLTKLSCNASGNSSSPRPIPGNRGAFADVVSPGGRVGH